MRNLVFFVCAIDLFVALAVTYSAITVQSDAAGRGMVQGFAIVIVGAVMVFALPAFGMALANRYLVVALILAAIPLIGTVFLLG